MGAGEGWRGGGGRGGGGEGGGGEGGRGEGGKATFIQACSHLELLYSGTSE